jgi:hypothetical protein
MKADRQAGMQESKKPEWKKMLDGRRGRQGRIAKKETKAKKENKEGRQRRKKA